MIRYQEMVPDYYIEASRDFQVLCRMYDYAMNSLKYNIDSMQNLTDTRCVKDTVLPLLGDKLGIYDKEAFANRQMLDALPIALKYKGSLKSVNILLNAFLDSMDVFDVALALHSKDEESATEISEILHRPIGVYSIVIILSTFPSLTNLHVLDTYLKMVIPTGLKVEYAFGVQKEYFDRFKYKEYTFLFYTHRHVYTSEGVVAPYISMVKAVNHLVMSEIVDSTSPHCAVVQKAMINPTDNMTYYYKIKVDENTYTYSNTLPEIGTEISYKYTDTYNAVFDYVGTDNITTRREFVSDEPGTYSHTLKHKAVPIPPATAPVVYKITVNTNSGSTTKTSLQYNEQGVYNNIDVPVDCAVYIQYSYNKTKEFVDKVIEDIDVNAVGLATVMSKDQFSEV